MNIISMMMSLDSDPDDIEWYDDDSLLLPERPTDKELIQTETQKAAPCQ